MKGAANLDADVRGSVDRVAHEPLQLIERLCNALDGEAVTYCHWKSTNLLHRSERGEADLDLLVSVHDLGRFERVLRKLGFKEGFAPRTMTLPGIRHFYGLDDGSGTIVDVHAHDRLVLGDDATKNYRLPIEDAYLESVTRNGVFMVPAPELEYVVLLVRLMVKHGTPEAILTARGKLSVNERAELAHLSNRIDENRMQGAVTGLASFLDPGVIHDCERALRSACSLPDRLAAWRDLSKRLAPFARRPRAIDIWLQGWRRLSRRFHRLVLRRAPRKRLGHRGALVAVIGADGAGKSTLVHGLAEWLSTVTSTVTMHLGKPPRSIAWLAVRASTRVRRGVRSVVRRSDVGNRNQDPTRLSTRLSDVLIARDRFRASRRARRKASRGAVVICDRYPLPGLVRTDGMRVDAAFFSRLRLTARWLAILERRTYGLLEKPDVVVVLQVQPDTAASRRLEGDPSIPRERAREILDVVWPRGFVVVDADGSAEEVLSSVKESLWPRL